LFIPIWRLSNLKSAAWSSLQDDRNFFETAMKLSVSTLLNIIRDINRVRKGLKFYFVKTYSS
jgi:hypothetical protein